MVEMTEYKRQFVYSTLFMADIISGQLSEAEFRQQLLDKYDETNGGDEAAEEGFGQDTIQEAQTAETGQQDGGASHTSDNTTDLGMHDAIVIGAAALLYAVLDNTSDE